MTKLERFTWALLCIGTACTELHGQTVRFSAEMLHDLGQIADTAQIEHYRCLLGAIRNDTLYITLAYEPFIKEANAVAITPAPCPPYLTWGEWHNHVPRMFTTSGEDRGPVMLPLALYCELSPADRHIWPSSPPLQLINVNRNESCAWVIRGGRYERLPWPPSLK